MSIHVLSNGYIKAIRFLTLYHFRRGFKRFSTNYSNERFKFAISMADTAQSAPLFPAFVPARSMACSMVSVVTMPKITGTPVAVPAWAMPFAASLQT